MELIYFYLKYSVTFMQADFHELWHLTWPFRLSLTLVLLWFCLACKYVYSKFVLFEKADSVLVIVGLKVYCIDAFPC